MLAPIDAAMILIEAHSPSPLNHGVLFLARWPVALPIQVLGPKQPKYGRSALKGQSTEAI